MGVLFGNYFAQSENLYPIGVCSCEDQRTNTKKTHV